MEASDIPLLAARGLRIRRSGRLVLDVTALSLREGEVFAVIGPNGSGKTTLLLALALLLPLDEGEIRVTGRVANKRNSLSLRRQMAAVFQEPLLLSTSVAANVAAGLKLRHASRAEVESRVGYWLERFGIGHLRKRHARSLSGGEAQRVSLARAFALQPRLLFLDEPFAALDAPTREALTADLLGALRETRTATLMVTHDRDEALAFADTVGVLIAGELRQMGAPAEVFTAPVSEEVASFVGVETVVPGSVEMQDAGLAAVRVAEVSVEVASELPAGTPVLFCVRPEDVTIEARSSSHQSSSRNHLAGVVISVMPWHGQVQLTVDCGFALKALVTRRSAIEMALTAGSLVVVSFKANAAHLIERKGI